MFAHLHMLSTRFALRALAGGRAISWLQPQMRLMRRVVVGHPRSPRPGPR